MILFPKAKKIASNLRGTSRQMDPNRKLQIAMCDRLINLYL